MPKKTSKKASKAKLNGRKPGNKSKASKVKKLVKLFSKGKKKKR